MRRIGLILGLLAISAVGCDAERGGESGSTNRVVSSRNVDSKNIISADAYEAPSPAGERADATMVLDASESTKPDPSKAKEPAAAGRKIIYNATIDLVAEDLGAFDSKLTKLVAAEGAYVADSDRSGSAGSTRRGSWKVRVPVDSYDSFVKGVVGLGELVSLKANSQDVSEEYFDLDARQAAKKVEEQRLLKHLTDSTGKLDEILAVERELSRVRTEIERMQGRLRALANLASLATVTITASEVKGYVPPQAPTFGTRVSRTFRASVDNLVEFGEGVVIVVVAVAPWLPVLVVGLGLVVLIARRMAAPTGPARPTDVTPPPAR